MWLEKKIFEKLSPQDFMSLDGFHKRQLHPGEPISVYVHEMKRLLSQAIPELVGGPRNQLLLHQFLSGIPEGHEISCFYTSSCQEYQKTLVSPSVRQAK